MLPLLIFGELLLEQVRQGVTEPVLLEVRPGDARGIVRGRQVIDLPNLTPILAAGDGGGIAHRHRFRGGSLDGKGHGQRQRHGAKGKYSFHGVFLLLHRHAHVLGGGSLRGLLPLGELGQGLLVGVQHRLMELLVELLGARETDIPVLTA